MTHKIWNASNLSGTAAFLALIASTGAVEGEMYITALALLAVFAGCTYLSIREAGAANRNQSGGNKEWKEKKSPARSRRWTGTGY